MKFGTNIHGPQRMISYTEFSEPLTFPPAGKEFHLSCEISQHLRDALAQLFTDFHGFQTTNPNDFGDPLTFFFLSF